MEFLKDRVRETDSKNEEREEGNNQHNIFRSDSLPHDCEWVLTLRRCLDCLKIDLFLLSRNEQQRSDNSGYIRPTKAWGTLSYIHLLPHSPCSIKILSRQPRQKIPTSICRSQDSTHFVYQLHASKTEPIHTQKPRTFSLRDRAAHWLGLISNVLPARPVEVSRLNCLAAVVCCNSCVLERFHTLLFNMQKVQRHVSLLLRSAWIKDGRRSG